VDECTTSSQVMSVTGVGGEPATHAHTQTGVGGEPATQAHIQTGVGGEPATQAHIQTGVGGEPATHAHIQTGVVLECSFPRFPRMRAQAASETGLPGFSGGKKMFCFFLQRISRFFKIHQISLPFALLMVLKQTYPIKKCLVFLTN